MKHNPRLPELGGMTEAGFNRVVAMIQPWHFEKPCSITRSPFGHYHICVCKACAPEHPQPCALCERAHQSFLEWRASLPKTRNKKQRKADAKL